MGIIADSSSTLNNLYDLRRKIHEDTKLEEATKRSREEIKMEYIDSIRDKKRAEKKYSDKGFDLKGHLAVGAGVLSLTLLFCMHERKRIFDWSL